LPSTKTLESAIAPAPSMGDSSVPFIGNSAPAATGISTTYQAKARNRFCAILRMVAREIASAPAPCEIARHQHHVGGFDGHIRAGADAIPASAAASAGRR